MSVRTALQDWPTQATAEDSPKDVLNGDTVHGTHGSQPAEKTSIAFSAREPDHRSHAQGSQRKSRIAGFVPTCIDASVLCARLYSGLLLTEAHRD